MTHRQCYQGSKPVHDTTTPPGHTGPCVGVLWLVPLTGVSLGRAQARQIAAKKAEKATAAAAKSAAALKIGDCKLGCQTGEYGGAGRHMVDDTLLCWPVLFVYEEQRER